jgi:hypothetical protein
MQTVHTFTHTRHSALVVAHPDPGRTWLNATPSFTWHFFGHHPKKNKCLWKWRNGTLCLWRVQIDRNASLVDWERSALNTNAFRSIWTRPTKLSFATQSPKLRLLGRTQTQKIADPNEAFPCHQPDRSFVTEMFSRKRCGCSRSSKAGQKREESTRTPRLVHQTDSKILRATKGVLKI